MDHATEKSVRGDFNDASFDYYGVRSRFSRKDRKFLVETDGPDGKLATFEVKYTFGVYPLQQYLIEFSDGRIQALSIAWDNRPKEQGGQRWFHLYPDEDIKHGDILHWTKLNQNWNFMCAECHSTGVRKNYDATNDRFSTTFAEISVGCETCHAAEHHSPCASTSVARSAGGTIRKQATRSVISTRPFCARKSRPAGYATRAALNFPRIGVLVTGCQILTSFRGSVAGSFTPMGRCGMKSTITARSSRAKCLQRASPAAIATTRTATS